MALPIKGEMPKGQRGSIKTMNKKAYITPEMEVMNVETVEMIAASVMSINDEEAETQLGAGRRGSWGNLWD